MNFSYYQSLLILPKLSAWIILIWNLRVVKEVEKRSMIDYRWMRVTLDTFYTWYASVTTWTSLASSQHYYAVVSKDHVCCVKIDRYMGSSILLLQLTVMFRLERDCPAAIQSHSVFDRQVSVSVFTLAVVSVAHSEENSLWRLWDRTGIEVVFFDWLCKSKVW